MSSEITCPNCGTSFGAPDDVSDYDWESGCSLGGRLDMDCHYCGYGLKLEARASIYDVEVIDD